MKRRFQEEGIEIASTGQTILMQLAAAAGTGRASAMLRRAAG